MWAGQIWLGQKQLGMIIDIWKADRMSCSGNLGSIACQDRHGHLGEGTHGSRQDFKIDMIILQWGLTEDRLNAGSAFCHDEDGRSELESSPGKCFGDAWRAKEDAFLGNDDASVRNA